MTARSQPRMISVLPKDLRSSLSSTAGTTAGPLVLFVPSDCFGRGPAELLEVAMTRRAELSVRKLIDEAATHLLRAMCLCDPRRPATAIMEQWLETE